MDLNTDTNCFWITGLSAAGKTTLSQMLVEHLRSKGKTVILLDGDELRKIFSNKSYSREDRLEITLKYSRLCTILVNQKFNVVIGVIGLFNEVHQWNRQNIPGYIEVFVDVPMEELKKRDPNNLYKKAEKGQIKNVYGIDLDAEFPKNPDVHLLWSPGKSVENTFDDLLNKILRKKELK